jgi:UDP-N-acetylglucosamine--N-acetylmuramyl-(pentapeptide) pyrophosphoryl-undecaprenol N-acetylglucosamine transferase
MMTIVLTGGGSGGHITPILAVADELKKQRPDVRLVYVGQTGDNLGDVPRAHHSIDAVYTVRAGKFRRYHGQGWRQAFDMRILLKNIRDGFYVLIGVWQSYRLLKKLQPAVIFTPGGFVGVPVGIAAAKRHIPFITHDLDAMPGLANRINSKWAVAHAVAMPVGMYNYPKDKTFYVGVPVSDAYREVSNKMQVEYREGLGINTDARVLCVTGGGLGAQRLNEAVAELAPDLLTKYPNLVILHIAGRKNEADLVKNYEENLYAEQRKRVVVKGFVNDLYRYSAAADVIVTRAGATNLAEFSLQHKACIVVPNPMLAGGHQLKNAELLEKAQAVVVVQEGDLKTELLPSIRELLGFSEKRQTLAEAFGKFAKPDASAKLAKLIIETAEGKGLKS